MKIAICADTFVPMTNGAAVFIDNLAKGLAKRHHHVVVVCPSFKNEKHSERLSGFLEVAHLSSRRFPFYPDEITPVENSRKIFGHKTPKLFYKNGLWVSPSALREVPSVLRRFQPDVIHIQSQGPVGLAAQRFAKSHKIAQVVTSHNYPDTTGTGNLFGPIKKPVDFAVKTYMASFVKNSEAATAPTEIAVSDLIPTRRAFRKIPVHAISNGVDLSSFTPGHAPKSLYKKFSLPPSAPVVLHVGRLDPEKKIDVLIWAFSYLVKKLPEARLLVVGDGTAREGLERLAKRLEVSDKVIFSGRVFPPELYDIYKLGTVFATASEVETQGIVLIEAAATGLPLVAVDKGAAPEACQDGRNGLLCSAGSAEDISEALYRILTDNKLRKQLSRGSLDVAHENDLGETITAFEDVYREAIKINSARLTKRGK